MNLKPGQLESHLRKQLAAVYFISGDDPLRVMEAADAVRVAARAQGYDEREVLTVLQGFDWGSLLSEAGNLSLFSQRRIIDLRLPTGKPGKEGAQALRDFAEQSPEDTLLLITAGKLEPAARKSKWVQALDRAGVVLFIWPLKGGELVDWVHARMRKRGLEPTAGAVEMLTNRVEGNLLACVQEIDKLHLLNGEGPVDVADIAAMVGDNARYDVFGLVDSALQGDAARCVRILHGLQAEATATPIIVWALARELRSLVGMTSALAQGDTVGAVLARYRVWPDERKKFVGAALHRLSVDECKAMIRQCALADRVCKGRAAGNEWDELLQLTLRLAGKSIFPDTPAMDQAC